MFPSLLIRHNSNMQADATRGHDEFGGVDEGFFDGMEGNHDVRHHHY
jgi:hypothetical protein